MYSHDFFSIRATNVFSIFVVVDTVLHDHTRDGIKAVVSAGDWAF